MKLYDDKLAVNPRRVRIYLAEKGITVPTEQISVIKGEHKNDDYRQISPLAQVPALTLDSGDTLTETMAICRYFEVLNPEPRLFGTSALEQATIEMWSRRAEFNFLLPVAMCFRHTVPAMAHLEEQNAAWGELNRARALKMMKFLNRQLETRKYLAGDDFSVADITAMCTTDFAKFTDIHIPEACTHLQSWYARVQERPSSKA